MSSGDLASRRVRLDFFGEVPTVASVIELKQEITYEYGRRSYNYNAAAVAKESVSSPAVPVGQVYPRGRKHTRDGQEGCSKTDQLPQSHDPVP